MLKKVYTIYDEKAQIYASPVCLKTRAEFVRSITMTLSSDNDSLMSLHPADFIAYEIGVFNEIDGVLQVYEKPENLGRLIDYK